MTKTLEIAQDAYERHQKAFEDNKENFPAQVAAIADAVIKAFKEGKRIYASGNGGSSCDAMHLCEELVGRYCNNRPSMPAHSLHDPSTMTCIGNDFGYDQVFARQLEAYGQEGDIYIGISTSGNSKNVIEALRVAKEKGMITVAFLGKDGGKMKGTADFELLAKNDETARIQEMHITAIHTIMECVDRIIHGV